MMKRLLTVMLVTGLSGAADADNRDWDAVVDASYEYLQSRQDTLEREFDLSKHERWDYDQDTGQLMFSSDGGPAVIADIQFIGSISTLSDTWLWSWANPHIDDELSAAIEQVREYGEERGFGKLTESKWAAEEVDGWEMSAVASYVLKAKGVYRAPWDDALAFMLITDIGWVE